MAERFVDVFKRIELMFARKIRSIYDRLRPTEIKMNERKIPM